MNLNVLLKPTLEQVFLCVVVGDADVVDNKLLMVIGDQLVFTMTMTMTIKLLMVLLMAISWCDGDADQILNGVDGVDGDVDVNWLLMVIKLLMVISC